MADAVTYNNLPYEIIDGKCLGLKQSGVTRVEVATRFLGLTLSTFEAGEDCHDHDNDDQGNCRSECFDILTVSC